MPNCFVDGPVNFLLGHALRGGIRSSPMCNLGRLTERRLPLLGARLDARLNYLNDYLLVFVQRPPDNPSSQRRWSASIF